MARVTLDAAALANFFGCSVVSILNFRIFLAQHLTDEKKNKSRFFSGFYIAPKKTAPPFLIWNLGKILGKFFFENF